MSSTSATAARCTSCRELRDPAELLLVRIQGRPAYSVCRPSRSRFCFRDATGPREHERIEVLGDYLARQDAPQAGAG